MTTMGLAPEAQLVIMKVFDANGTGRMDSILAAVEDAIALGVDCANLSLGIASGPMYYAGITEIYDAAYEAGINVVVSAGNDAFTGYQSLWGPGVFPIWGFQHIELAGPQWRTCANGVHGCAGNAGWLQLEGEAGGAAPRHGS